MGTPCEFCGSRDKSCENLGKYVRCDEALFLAEKEYGDIVDFELRYYPDEDQDEPAVDLPNLRRIKPLGQPEDVINIPNHYAKWEIEPITFVMKNGLPFAEGNVIKYTMRHRDKNGLEDIKKAIKYLKFIAEMEYGAEL